MPCERNTANYGVPKSWSETLPLPSARTPRTWADVLPLPVAVAVLVWSDRLPQATAATPASWAPECAAKPLPTNTIYTFAGEPLILFRLPTSDATPITTF
jgi:hypothetical protein